ncbi:hypothetical protein DSO57_1017077 [Entomophthora muscae]|uniref:Uncharacterized protein n=1 Tax=Entomophthora muscae TaxID=34485 RepID=A0ACC2STE2_9FUNG|nr:hypothetical protein DSO57_1017077 [Entomophthora muscae]
MGVPPPPPPPPAGGAPPPALPSVPDDRFSLLKSIQAGTKLRKVGAPEAREKVDAPPQPPASSGDGNLASALMSILENRRNDLESDEEDEDDDWDD